MSDNEKFKEAKEFAKQEQNKALKDAKINVIDEELLAPLTYARKLMMQDLQERFEAKGEELSEADYIAIGVYILYEKDLVKLRKSIRKPDEFIGKSYKFADNKDQDLYEKCVAEATRKLNQLNVVEQLADDGKPGEDLPKKSQS